MSAASACTPRPETAALLDTRSFIDRARDLYGYAHFVCDCSGSIVEIVDPDDPADPVLSTISQSLLIVLIEGSEAHEEALKARFDRAPKPMYYREDFPAPSLGALSGREGRGRGRGSTRTTSSAGASRR
ncbi:MAG: hypothetical protein KatS3mg118_1561 [Paracoccaceae bacterium]|nr:MAG: hypothetical protein KatS3mg118_1561 [Paracoccaceae bacterium]